jgi:hypothetical protein
VEQFGEQALYGTSRRTTIVWILSKQQRAGTVRVQNWLEQLGETTTSSHNKGNNNWLEQLREPKIQAKLEEQSPAEWIRGRQLTGTVKEQKGLVGHSWEE